MKYWIPSNWKNTFDHEGLLFFVQRMQEMLFHFSDDINRAPVHNTLTLIQEYRNIYVEVKSGTIGEYQLIQIYDEFKDSFHHDKILRKNLGDTYIEKLYNQLNACPDPNKFNLIGYIWGVINPSYMKWTVEYLKEHISQGTHKNEIEKGARIWVANQIMYGYTGEFIYSYIEQFLVNNEIDSLDILDEFFNRFDFKKRKYKVYIQLSENMSKYFEMLKIRLDLKFEDDGNFSLIQKKRKQKKKRVLCYLEVEALDYYKAVDHAFQKINIFLKYFQFISDNRSHLLHKFGAVWDCENENIYQMPVVPTGFKAIETHTSEVSASLIDKIILGIQMNGNRGMEVFGKALVLHNSALQQQLPKDGFVNLWSILEVFCPQGTAKSKIEPILYSILPVLQNNYFTIMFQTIRTDLEENLLPNDYDELMENLEGETNILKIAGFCLLPQYEQLREDVFRKMEVLPLLRHKIYSLYLLKNNKKELFDLSRRYRQRVQWHLYRLYRARNSIVHTGSVPPRIQVLGEHLHSYVDSVMSEIAFKLSVCDLFPNISSVFVDTALLMKSKEEHFNNNGAVTLSDLNVLLEDFFCPQIK